MAMTTRVSDRPNTDPAIKAQELHRRTEELRRTSEDLIHRAQDVCRTARELCVQLLKEGRDLKAP
jgi:hypothetical protein